MLRPALPSQYQQLSLNPIKTAFLNQLNTDSKPIIVPRVSNAYQNMAKWAIFSSATQTIFYYSMLLGDIIPKDADVTGDWAIRHPNTTNYLEWGKFFFPLVYIPMFIGVSKKAPKTFQAITDTGRQLKFKEGPVNKLRITSQILVSHGTFVLFFLLTINSSDEFMLPGLNQTGDSFRKTGQLNPRFARCHTIYLLTSIPLFFVLESMMDQCTTTLSIAWSKMGSLEVSPSKTVS